MIQIGWSFVLKTFKVESRYKQCEVTPQFSIGQNLLKRNGEKKNPGTIN